MCSRAPGKKISAFLNRAGTLVLVLIILAPVPALSRNQEGKAAAEPPPAPAPVVNEIILTGKVFTSMKRGVDLPFKGIITSLPAKSGQRVEAGEVLATYRLSPEALLSIEQRLSPGHIAETQVRLAEVERSLVPLNQKKQELSRLVQKKLAPPESLSQVTRERQLVIQEQAALRERLRNERRTLALDQALLGERLGNSLKDRQIPREASLVAPISGYVVWISPEMREGAELPPTPGVLQVGVMDPMVARLNAFEIEAQQIQPGVTAQITLESLPGKKFEGKVTRVSWSAQTLRLDQPSYFDVELVVPNPDLLLKEGLKVRIVFKKSR